MKKAPNILRSAALILLALFVGPMSFPEEATANRVLHFSLKTEEEAARFAVQLEAAPRYALKVLDGGRVSLTLLDTSDTPQLRERLKGKEGPVTVQEEGQSPHLCFLLQLEAAVREVRTSWFKEEKILLLSMGLKKKQDIAKVSRGRPPTFKGLRFGVEDSYTRLVSDLDAEPRWEFARRGEDALELRFESDRVHLKKRAYTGIRRIRKIAVAEKDRQVILRLKADRSVDHFRVFWLKIGNRLVMDIMDEPVDPPDEDLLPGAESLIQAREKESGPGEVSRAGEAGGGPEIKEGIQEGEKGEALYPETASKVEPELAEPSPAESGFIVRQRIRKAVERDPKRGGHTVRRVIHKVQVNIEPDVEEGRPEGLYNKAWVRHLSSEEAFLIGRIQEAWETRRYEKGAELMEQFLKEFPDSPLDETVCFLLGDFRLALLKRGEKDAFPKVIESYAQAVSRYKESARTPQAYVRMAQANAYMGRDFEALGYLNTVISRFREGDHLSPAYLDRGRVHLRLNQPDRAIEDLQTVMSRFPQSPAAGDARYEIAKYFFSVGVYDEAEKRLREIGDKQPEFYLKNPEYLSLVARTAFYQKDYRRAREFFFLALNLGRQPETGDMLLSRIGDTYQQEGQDREAEKFYRMAMEYDPEGEGAAIAELRLANYSSGVTAFEAVHKGHADSPIGDLALLNLATRFYEQKKYAMAMDTLRKVMEKPNHPDLYGKARDLYSRVVEEEVKKVYRDLEYEKVVTLHRSWKLPAASRLDPEVCLMVAQAYRHLHQRPEAIGIFETINPNDLSLPSRGAYVLDLADTYLREGKREKGEHLLETAARVEMRHEDRQKIMVMLADLKREKGDLNKAYELYDALVRAEKKLSDIEIAAAYLAMGEISNLERRYEKARESLSKGIALAEKDKKGREILRSALMEMGNAYYREGDHSQAIRAFQKGFDLGYGYEEPDYWELTYRLAMSFQKTGNNGAAEGLFNAISEEGDPMLQQKVQIRMGMIELEKQLNRLPIGRGNGEESF